MATSKVVRVEDVLDESPSAATSPLQILNNESIEGGKSPADSSQACSREGREESAENKEDLEHSGALAEGETDEEEQEDKVYPLPENWPRIKELKRPMSCALSISRLPCVRKAVSHLELIQNIIDEWFRRTVEEAKSRASTAASAQSVQVPASQRKQLRFKDPSTRSTSRSGETTGTAVTSRGSTASGISVMGMGLDDSDTTDEREVEEEGLDIPYLGAEDVIEETITLLARLELDRQEAQRAYMKEVETVATLKKKTNDLRLRRLREMPALVQREHEACTVDLNELNWHVSYVTRAEAKAQSRKDIAETLNKSLKKDIAYIKQHIPLVEEKLVLELAAMDRIKKAQVETNQELMTTKQRQAKTEQKSTEAMTKAETERGHIKRELDIVRDNLSSISEELSTAKMTYNSYVHQVNDVQQQLADNETELKLLEVKLANAKAAEEMQATKVRNLQNKIAEAEFEYERLENENNDAEEELRVLKAKNAARIADLMNKFKALETKLQEINRRNQELNLLIEDTQEKIRQCDAQRIADEKNLKRIARELERVTTMFQATSEEHARVLQINNHIRDQLHSEQEKAFRVEEALKNQVESLQRQVKEEMHTHTVLQARINSDTAEIEKTRGESAKKKEKADKVASDVNAAVDSVQEKEIADLENQLQALKQKHQETMEHLKKQLEHITPHFNDLKAQLSSLEAEIKVLLDDIEAVEDERRMISEEMYKMKCVMDVEDAEELQELRKIRVERLKRTGPEHITESGPEPSQSGEVQSKKEKLTKTNIVHISASATDLAPVVTPGRAGFEKDVERTQSDSEIQVLTKPEAKRRSSGCSRFMEGLREEVSKLNKQLDHMAWKTDLMTKKIQEMDSSQAMMDKVYAKTQAAISELTAELEELNLQLETVRKIGNDLNKEYSAVVDRIKDSETHQTRYLAERNVVLRNLEDEKVRLLAKNKELASRYRQLQNEYFIVKERLLRSYDERLKLESTITDVKQLKSLQSKMHSALAEYFKLSGLYNEGELVRLEQASVTNGLRVGQLQDEMEEALSLITNFLSTEMDGTKARQMAMEAVRKMEDKNNSGGGGVGVGLGKRQSSSVVMAS
ncbi:hypothetical protein BaRGS_00025284 [Batillaria attramentaria]|uniref:Coiled-coil domain-containing protein 178 n=1 Tax=Batillaria attramentaria TaxID=370345 RepID=A0ABD0K8W5_9CAEN